MIVKCRHHDFTNDLTTIQNNDFLSPKMLGSPYLSPRTKSDHMSRKSKISK